MSLPIIIDYRRTSKTLTKFLLPFELVSYYVAAERYDPKTSKTSNK